jgi:hypothetical protein
VSQIAVPTAVRARVVDTRCEHPLVTSVATVDRVVKLLSFRVLDVSGAQWPRAPWMGCEHALSDPTSSHGGGGWSRNGSPSSTPTRPSRLSCRRGPRQGMCCNGIW